MGFNNFAQKVLEEELLLLNNLEVETNLKKLLVSPTGCQAFARAFYFVRYSFYRLNFIVGTRSGPDETLWSGLVHSLHEEVGGLGGKSHNELYRDFLREVGVKSEQDLKQPVFAARFNQAWEGYCSTAPFEEALAGVAIFEILDQPDYALLFRVMKDAGISTKGLRFFEVHAQAQHFDFFQEIVVRFWKHKHSRSSLLKAASFVNSSQRQMWSGLLSHLTKVMHSSLIPASKAC
jgi:Iron-containing redox enzyme